MKAAFRLGSTKCKIVDIEFIKDCLILAKKPKLVPENPYELKRIHARKRKLRVTAGPLVVPCVGEVAGSKEVVEPRKSPFILLLPSLFHMVLYIANIT